MDATASNNKNNTKNTAKPATTKTQTAPMGIGNTNRIVIDKDSHCIIGIASNPNRTPTGKLVAKYQNHTIECPLANAIVLNHEQETFKGNRQVALENIKAFTPYSLSLKISDNYTAPLSHITKIEGADDEALDIFCAKSWLVPIALKMYTSHDLDFSNAQNVSAPSTGFIYLFLGGYLWREIAITTADKSDTYTLEEVNLTADWGKSTRESRIPLNDDTILVPQVINGKTEEIAIAHSLVQWSWNQLMAMGGLHEQDPRIAGEQLDLAQKKSQLQKDRLQTLPHLLPWMPVKQNNVDSYLQCLQTDSLNYHIPTVVLFNPLAIASALATECILATTELKKRYDDLPNQFPHYAAAELIHRFVFDPTAYKRSDDRYDIEGAEREARALFNGELPSYNDGQKIGQFRTYLKEKYNNPEKEDKKLHALYKSISEHRFGNSPDYQRKDQAAKFIRDLADDIDHDTLNNTLFPQNIREAINDLEKTRKTYFDWVNGKALNNTIKAALFDDIQLHATLADFSNLDPDLEDTNLLLLHQIWLLLAFPCHNKASTISDLYEQMDRRSPSFNRRPDVGEQWLNAILDDDNNPIHKMLFASAEHMDANTAYLTEGDLPEVPFDGAGLFRPKAFAQAVKLLQDKDEAINPQNDQTNIAEQQLGGTAANSAVGPELMGQEQKRLSLSLRLIDDFFGWVNGLMPAGTPEDPFYQKRQSFFIRTAQAAQHNDLKGIHLVQKGQTLNTQKFIVLGANNIRMQELSGKHNNAARVEQFHKEGLGSIHSVDILDATTGKKIGSSLLSQERQWHKGVTPPLPGAVYDPISLWSQSSSRGRDLTKVTADFDVIAVSTSSRWSVAQAHLGAADNAHKFDIPVDALSKSVTQGARNVKVGASLAMLYFEVMTLKTLMDPRGPLRDGSEGRLNAAILVSLISLINSTAESTAAIATAIGRHSLAEWLETRSILEFQRGPKTINLAALKTVSSIVGIATAAFSAIDAAESAKRNDYDASVALAVGALTGGALGIAGAGAALQLGWALAIPNPVIWGLIAVSIIAALCANHFRDKPLQDWVKQGPFGRKAFKGGYSPWQNDPQTCYQALMGQLIQPSLTLSEGRDDHTGQMAIIASLRCPVFALEQDEVTLYTTASHKPLMGGAYPGGGTAPYYSSMPQQPVQPYRIEQDAGSQCVTFHYFFAVPAYIATSDLVEWRARAQVTLKGATLPIAYKPHVFNGLEAAPKDIDDDQINWILATPLTSALDPSNPKITKAANTLNKVINALT